MNELKRAGSAQVGTVGHLLLLLLLLGLLCV